MDHIKIIGSFDLSQSVCDGGCGECQASCQSACKTSCTVANQECEKNK
ncbi:MAG: six-cysteine ranthipeptide SCIFF [Oscillospiraceae bacterium]|nr:six-cysteine ranthipeptide SCIFF [Oscillospiraceae bacterium]